MYKKRRRIFVIWRSVTSEKKKKFGKTRTKNICAVYGYSATVEGIFIEGTLGSEVELLM